MKSVCVIPAWNESQNISKVLNQVKRHVGEIVVVDDGSADDTYELAKQAGVTALRHRLNRGQGAALRTGTTYALGAGADIIVHFDADGQFLAEEIAELAAPIVRGEAEVVFGSRFLGKDSNLPAFKKKIILPLARLINRWFLDVRTTDPQSGFRALSRRAAETIGWQQDGMAHCSEILAEASRLNLKIKEVPITVIYNRYGQGFGGGLKILKDLFVGALLK